MSQPPPLHYQSPTPTSADVSNLKVLSILHYVWGGLAMLLSCFFIIYIVLGVMMATGSMGSLGPSPAPGFGTPAATSSQPPPQVGWFLTGFGSCAVIAGWAMGLCTIVSGRKMARRQSRIFSIVIAGINCMWFPLGTLLGVFTIIILAKESVGELYHNA